MKIYQFTYNPFQENAYVLVDEENNGVIIDPGCYETEEEKHFFQFFEENNIKPLALLNTHAHLDHIMGNQMVKNSFDIPLYLHKEDLFLIEGAQKSANLYGLHKFKSSPEPDIFLEDGDHLQFGQIKLDVLFTPGHAPGHVVFYNKENEVVVNGDVLFKGSYGRVDLPGGDFETLKTSINEKMFKLPDDTKVLTGHGQPTSIGREKESNPINY
jgi:glyoxylase-like metal-dependent hydrolase (beta-lactamase superfamily II)